MYIFDTKTFALIGAIALPNPGQLGIAVSQDGLRLYVSSAAGSCGNLGRMTVVDTVHGVVLANFEIFPQSGPRGSVVIGDNSRFVYTVGSAMRTVSIIDSRSNAMVAAIVVGSRPAALVIKQE